MLTFQQWGKDEGEVVLSPVNQQTIERTLRAMEKAFSSMLTIEREQRSLIIGANRGKYQVTALLGDDDTYDLVGNPRANGYIPLVLGGQEAPFPRRYIVQPEQALSAALEFLHTGTVMLDHRWEHQRDPSSAWQQRQE